MGAITVNEGFSAVREAATHAGETGMGMERREQESGIKGAATATAGQRFPEGTDKSGPQARMSRQQELAEFIGSKIHNRMAINNLRDRSAAIEKWRSQHPGAPLPAEFNDIAKYRETLIDKVYCWYLDRKNGAATLLSEGEMTEYRSIAEKLSALADKLEAAGKGKGRGGLADYLTLAQYLQERAKKENRTVESYKEEEIKTIRLDYFLSDCSISKEELETYRKARYSFDTKGLSYDVYLSRFQERMDHYSHRRAPMKADRFIAICAEEGVDPILALSQAAAESNVGIAGAAVDTHNFCNVGNTDDGSLSHKGSWENGLRSYCRQMKRAYGVTLAECAKRDFTRTDNGDRYASNPNYTAEVLKIGTDLESHIFKGA